MKKNQQKTKKKVRLNLNKSCPIQAVLRAAKEKKMKGNLELLAKNL